MVNHRRPSKEEIRAIKAKMRNTSSSDKFDLMVKNLQKYGLVNHRMNASDIAFSHYKNFGVGKVPSHVNPRYTGYFNSIPESETKKMWDKMSEKQKYHYLRPTFTEEWARQFAKKNWSQLNSQQKGLVSGVEIDKARKQNSTSRDATRFGQGNYGKAVPLKDKRKGKTIWDGKKEVTYR